MLGIQETLDVIRFSAAFGNGLGLTLQDGKFDYSELINFVPSLTKLPAAIGGIDNVWDELLDLDEAEMQTLVETVAAEFDIPQEDTEDFVEEAIDVALKNFAFARKWFIKTGAEG